MMILAKIQINTKEKNDTYIKSEKLKEGSIVVPTKNIIGTNTIDGSYIEISRGTLGKLVCPDWENKTSWFFNIDKILSTKKEKCLQRTINISISAERAEARADRGWAGGDQEDT